MAHRRVCVTRRLGAITEGHQQLPDAFTMSLPRLQDPIVVEVGQQLVATQREGVGVPSRDDQTVDLAHIDPKIRALDHSDALAVGDQVFAGCLSELPAQRRQRRSQARPGAALQDVRPEDGRHARPRLQSRVIRQPAQKGPRPTTRNVIQSSPLQLEAKLAEETDAQHLAATL